MARHVLLLNTADKALVSAALPETSAASAGGNWLMCSIKTSSRSANTSQVECEMTARRSFTRL